MNNLLCIKCNKGHKRFKIRICVYIDKTIFLNKQSIKVLHNIFFNFKTKLKFILYALIK